MRVKSGGGIQSNKTVQSKSGMKVEPKSRTMSPEAVGQQGASLAFARKPLEQGPGYTPGKMGDTGIAKAMYNPATSGPGSLRTTYPMPAGRDILSEYGRDIPGKGKR